MHHAGIKTNAKKYVNCRSCVCFLCYLARIVSGLAKQVAGHQGRQLQKVVGPDEKL